VIESRAVIAFAGMENKPKPRERNRSHDGGHESEVAFREGNRERSSCAVVRGHTHILIHNVSATVAAIQWLLKPRARDIMKNSSYGGTSIPEPLTSKRCHSNCDRHFDESEKNRSAA
jgi:hypothetical protein